MSPERWQNLKGELKDKFPVLAEGTEELDDRPGSFEFMELETPPGKVRLEYWTQPLVLDKKTTTSRRIGASVAVDYIYSEDEVTNRLQVFQWNEAAGDWDEVKKSMFE